MKIKEKFWFMLAMPMIIVSLEGNAQAFELPDFQDGKAVWTIRAGVGLNGVVGSYKETAQLQWEDAEWDGKFKANMGYNLSFGFTKTFGDHPLYWGMELGAGMRGYKQDAIDEDHVDYSVSAGSAHNTFISTSKQTLTCYNAQLSPFIIGYRFLFSDYVAADIHLGPYASYDFAGDYKVYTSEEKHYQTSSGNKDSFKEDENSVKIGDMDTMRKYDAGFNLGAGIWFGRFNLDFTWQRGFIAIYEGGDEEVKIGKTTHERGDLFTNNFQLKLGYAF